MAETPDSTEESAALKETAQEQPAKKATKRKKAEPEAAVADTSPAEAPAKRRALVTGASSGIGEEFARQLAKKRYDLVLVARRRERLEKLAEELAEAYGTNAEVIAGDLATPEGIHTVEKRIGQGDIDLLVNNAGFGTRGVFANMSVDRELEELDVNIKALVRLTRAALEQMVQKKRGIVINVGSTGSFQPVPYMSTYAATKAFVLHFSEGVHEEVKPHGVTVTCLCPGYVMTEFQQVAGIDRRRLRGAGKVPVQQVVESALKGAAAGRAAVIPGAFNRTLATGLVRLTPRFAVRRIAGSLFRDAGS
jgi:short-subunit dehydrogenase